MKVIDAPCVNGKSSDAEPKASINARQSHNPPARECLDTSESLSSHTVPLRSSGNAVMNHEDTLEVLQHFDAQYAPKVPGSRGLSEASRQDALVQNSLRSRSVSPFSCVCRTRRSCPTRRRR